MNVLDYRRSQENGLSFELLIDSKPLGELVGARNTEIPFWLFKDDLPWLPPDESGPDRELRIVTVCSCGEYGCGHTRCRVIRDDGVVVLQDFDLDVTSDGRRKSFQIAASNYDAVVKRILDEVSEYKRHSGPGE